jgi:hypothetical protein
LEGERFSSEETLTLQDPLRKSLPAAINTVEEFLKLMKEVPKNKVLLLKPGETTVKK